MCSSCVCVVLCTLMLLLAVKGTTSFNVQAQCSVVYNSSSCQPLNFWCIGRPEQCSVADQEESYSCEGIGECLRTNYCRQQTVTHSRAQTLARNLSITTAPTRSKSLEVTVQWDVDESDSTVTAYEVYMSINYGLIACACITNRTIRHVTFNVETFLLPQNRLKFEVVTRPYVNKENNRATLVHSTAFSDCSAFAYRPNHPVCRLHPVQRSHITASTEMVSDPNRGDMNSNGETDMRETTQMLKLSWNSGGNGVLVALVDDHSTEKMSCSTPGRNPPCFVVRNASSVTIGPLTASVQYSANLYSFDSSECTDSHIVHMFSGCDRGCCTESVPLPPPTLLTTSTTTTSLENIRNISSSNLAHLLTHSPTAVYLRSSLSKSQTVETDIYHMHTFTSTTQITSLPTSDHFPKVNDHTLGKSIISKLQTSKLEIEHYITTTVSTTPSIGPLLLRPSSLPSIRGVSPPSDADITTRSRESAIMVGVVGGVVIIAVMVVLIGVVLVVRKCRQSQDDTEHSEEAAQTHQCHHEETTHHTMSYSSDEHENGIVACQNTTEHWYGTINNGCDGRHHSEVESGPTMEESEEGSLQEESSSVTLFHSDDVLFHYDDGLLPVHVGSAKRVVIIYSQRSTEEDRDLIVHNLVGGLSRYEGVEPMSHDITCIKESPSQWLERETSRADAVLCICNQEFKQDWEDPATNQSQNLPLVNSLKHIVHATVNQGKSLSKYAVVLLRQTDKEGCIPSLYLQGDPRQFLIEDIDTIARFIKGIPLYCTTPS